MSLTQYLCQLTDIAYDGPQGGLNIDKINEMFDRLGDGCTRTVYAIPFDGKTYAVKFALWHSQAAHNRRERKLWNRSERSALRNLLAEVHAISTCGRILAMEMIPETFAESDFDYTDSREWNDKLNRALEAVGYTRNEVSILTCDNHNENVGVRANREIVWIDYAIGCSEY